MTAIFDRERHLLGRLKREIPIFRALIYDSQVTLQDLAEHRELVIEALEVIDSGQAHELATMREQLALYGLELVHLQLEVQRGQQRVESFMN